MFLGCSISKSLSAWSGESPVLFYLFCSETSSYFERWGGLEISIAADKKGRWCPIGHALVILFRVFYGSSDGESPIRVTRFGQKRPLHDSMKMSCRQRCTMVGAVNGKLAPYGLPYQISPPPGIKCRRCRRLSRKGQPWVLRWHWGEYYKSREWRSLDGLRGFLVVYGVTFGWRNLVNIFLSLR